jgi:hypothetical protein
MGLQAIFLISANNSYYAKAMETANSASPGFPSLQKLAGF